VRTTNPLPARLVVAPDHSALFAQEDALALRDGGLERGNCRRDVGKAAENLDDAVALIEDLDGISQVLDRVGPLEDDLPAADDPGLVHAGRIAQEGAGRKGSLCASARTEIARDPDEKCAEGAVGSTVGGDSCAVTCAGCGISSADLRVGPIIDGS
jgi:hypothetical protein